MNMLGRVWDRPETPSEQFKAHQIWFHRFLTLISYYYFKLIL